jgi:hypothetical protein
MSSPYLDRPIMSLEQAHTMLKARLARGGHMPERATRLRRMIRDLEIYIRGVR